DATDLQLQFLTRLAALVGARPGDADLARALKFLGEHQEGNGNWQVAILVGLGQGLQNSPRPLTRLWEAPPPTLKDAVAQARPFFTRASVTARDEQRSLADRITAARLLGSGPFATAAPALQELLAPRQPGELQMAAVRALSLHDHSKVGAILLAQWGSYSPAVRREVLEALFA